MVFQYFSVEIQQIMGIKYSKQNEMKKLRNVLIGLVLVLIIAWFFTVRYLNSGSLHPDNTVWESYLGRDTTVGILPDEYANYFTYTLARTNNNIGFKIKGKFPDTRYFSFNVYSLRDNATQGSLVDYQIQTDSGKPNPFLANKDSVDVGEDFTVYIVPAKHKDKNLPNILPFRDDVKLLAMAIRLYDYNIDDFGGVEFPTVEAFTMDDEVENIELKPVRLPRGLNLRGLVKTRRLPEMVRRLSLLYETENTVPLDAPRSNKKYFSIPFHAIDTKGFIENNDNRYLLSAITKKEDEVYVFKFKSPSYTTGSENINQTEVRYWSFNLGNSGTYNFNALKDEDALLDEDGFVNIVLANKDTEIEKQTKALGFNFLEWNMPWEKGLILFRHMLADSNFEAQIDDVPPIKEGMKDFTPTEGERFMGEYAPQGIRMSKEDFLFEYIMEEEKISVE